MPVNVNIWRNVITDMFILEGVGSVSIGLNKEKKEKKRKTIMLLWQIERWILFFL
jgi:hypothetical protein